MPWLYVFFVVVQVGLAVLNVIDGDRWQQVTAGLPLILWCVLSGDHLIEAAHKADADRSWPVRSP